MRRRWLLGAPLLVIVAVWQYSNTSRPADPKVACDVTLASPRTHLDIGSGGSLTVALSGRSHRCPGATVAITAKVNGGSSTTLGTTTTDTSGAWSYSTTVADQSTTVITASMTGNGITKSDFTTIAADTRNPTISIASPVLAADGSLVVVSGEMDQWGRHANLHVQAGDPGFSPDADTIAPGGQVNLDVTITGANPGALTVSQGATQKIVYAIASSPAHLTSTDLGVLTLDEGWQGALTIAVTGPTGAFSKVIPTYVKTTRPPPPVMMLGVQLSDGGYGPYPDGGCWTHVKDYHHADIEVCFGLPTDGGDIAGVDMGIANTQTLDVADAGGAVLTTTTAVSTPTIVDSSVDPHRVAESVIDQRFGSVLPVATSAIYCALNNPSVTTTTGTKITTSCNITSGTNWSCSGSVFYGWKGNQHNGPELTSSDHLYCISSDGQPANATLTQALQYNVGEVFFDTTKVQHCDPYNPRGCTWH